MNLPKENAKRHEHGDPLAAGGQAGAAKQQITLNKMETLLDFQNNTRAFSVCIAEMAGNVKTLDRYQFECRISEGGFAEVYRARSLDDSRRTVAIKMLGADGDSSKVQHHAEEIKTLSRLSHQNVVTLYEAWTTDDGTKYIVMEYIDGEPIIDICREKQLTLAERLDLFLRVCDAVAYLHTNSVVHGDLKPANILVREDLQPCLIDFGTARPSGTLVEQSVGFSTADYSCRTTTEKLRFCHDVESLGVVLHEVLVGGRPKKHRTDSEEDEFQVAIDTLNEKHAAECRSTVKALKKRLRGDIEAILRKAFDRVARRQYATAVQLADDIRRYLSGVPTAANPRPVWLRLQKWAMRNKAVASSIIVGFALLTLWLVTEIRLRTKTQHLLLSEREARQVTVDLNAKLQSALQSAQQAEADMKSAKQLTRQSIDRYVETLTSSRLLGEPGFRPLIIELLVEPLQYYSAVAEGDLQYSDPLDAAVALNTLGKILISLGKSSDALDALTRARKSLMSVAAPDRRTLIELGKSENRLAFLHYRSGQIEKALHHWQRDLEIAEQLMQSYSTDIEVVRLVTLAHQNVAIGKEAIGAHREALTHYKKALALVANIDVEDPANAELAYLKSACLINISDRTLVLDVTDEQLVAQLRSAQETLANLCRRYPHESQYSAARATCLSKLAEEDLENREEYLRKAVQSVQDAVSASPTDQQFSAELYASQRRLAEHLLDSRRPKEAQESFASARGTLEHLLGQNPDNAEWLVAYLEIMNNSMAVDLELMNAPSAIAMGREALVAITKYERSVVDESDSLKPVTASIHVNLGNALRTSGNFDEAITMLRSAADIMQQIALADPSEGNLRRLGETWHNLAVAFQENGSVPLAVKSHRQAYEIHLDILSRSNEDSANVRCATTEVELAALARKQGDLNAANELYSKARERLERLSSLSPEATRMLAACLSNSAVHERSDKAASESLMRAYDLVMRLPPEIRRRPRFEATLATVCDNLAKRYMHINDNEAALQYALQSQNIRERMLESSPESVEFQMDVASSFNTIGLLRDKIGELDAAMECYNQCLAQYQQVVTRHPGAIEARCQVAKTLNSQAFILYRRGKLEEARETQGKAISQAIITFELAPDINVHRETLSNVYVGLSRVNLAANRPLEAVHAIQERRKLWPTDARQLFSIACELAICIPLIGDQEKGLSELEKRERTRVASLAFESLTAAVKAGWHNSELLRTAPELQPIRNDKRFQTIVESLDDRP